MVTEIHIMLDEKLNTMLIFYFNNSLLFINVCFYTNVKKIQRVVCCNKRNAFPISVLVIY